MFHTPPGSRASASVWQFHQKETVQGSGDEQMTFWNRKPGEDINKKVPLNPRDTGLIEHHESDEQETVHYYPGEHMPHPDDFDKEEID